jgi:hypothetical protein
MGGEPRKVLFCQSSGRANISELCPVWSLCSVAPQRPCCRAVPCRTSQTCLTLTLQGVFKGEGVVCRGLPPQDLEVSRVQEALVRVLPLQEPHCLWIQLTDGPRRRTCWHRKRMILSCSSRCMISRREAKTSWASRKVCPSIREWKQFCVTVVPWFWISTWIEDFKRFVIASHHITLPAELSSSHSYPDRPLSFVPPSL